MNFREYLHNTAKEIDKELENFFKKWTGEAGKISLRLLPLSSALADACRGGKRIRGALVMLGYKMANGEWQMANRTSDIIRAAVAYEIFQAAILAHDDIIDKSLLRRGKPSLYAWLGGDHIGKSLAICLGDIGFFLAFKLIAESGFPEKEKNKALAIFSETMLETGIGELLDVELGNSRNGEAKPAFAKGYSEVKDIITVYEFKTAYYTITAPLLLGAVLGGLPYSSLAAIRIFGHNLGIAFQIQDDINDIFFEKKQLGREPGGDIREGKQTLLYVYARQHANKKQYQLLEKFYGNSVIGSAEIGVVKNVLVETGALEYVCAEAKKYSQKAKESIPGITKSEKFGEMFLEMTEYFVED